VKKILVCTQLRTVGNSCAARHNGLLPQLLRDAFASEKLACEVDEIKCFLRCNHGPNIKSHPDGKFWNHVDENIIPEIVHHVKNSQTND
jgi:(2Fe-2S) ferredoxin